MAEYTNIVPPRIPFLDATTGFVSREWYQFFFSLFNLTGAGASNVSLTDLQVGPPPLEVSALGAIVLPDFTSSMADTNAIQALATAQDDTLNWLGLHT
jgi:hypothetical protein